LNNNEPTDNLINQLMNVDAQAMKENVLVIDLLEPSTRDETKVLI
jgi:hypothetical protein